VSAGVRAISLGVFLVVFHEILARALDGADVVEHALAPNAGAMLAVALAALFLVVRLSAFFLAPGLLLGGAIVAAIEWLRRAR
jgi:hypothetical protein